MKYSIPLAAAFLIGLGLCLHHSPVEVPKYPRKASLAGVSAASASGPSRVDSPAAEPQPSMSGSASVAPPVSKADLPASRAPKGPALSRQKILASLEGALGLTELSKGEIDSILRRREEEIKALHDGMRRSEIVDMRRFEWEVNLLKAGWFRSIDGLLDGPQHERFIALVEKGLFNEGLAFTVEPGMTVLE